MDAVIVAVVSTALVQLAVLVGAVWSLASKLARIEEAQKGFVTVRECSAQQRECGRTYEHAEITSV